MVVLLWAGLLAPLWPGIGIVATRRFDSTYAKFFRSQRHLYLEQNTFQRNRWQTAAELSLDPNITREWTFLMRITCAIGCVLVTTLFLVSPWRVATAQNILLITADDMNWDSLGCFGNELEGVSPNLDELASQGVRFQHAYVTIAICQPCRASIMTGRYPHRSGALGFDKIKRDVPTLPEKLRENGYYTAAIGKA